MTVAWSRCGAEAFEFSVLEFCHPDRCTEREQWWIGLLKPEYNLSPTAGSPKGVKWSESAKEKIRGRSRPPTTQETKDRIRAALTGRKFTPETLAKMKLTQSTRIRSPLSPEGRDSIIRHMTGTKHGAGWVPTPEQREKMRLAGIGRKLSAHAKAALLKSNTGRKLSAETKAKMRLAALGHKRCVGRVLSPETREKIRLGNLRREWRPQKGWKHTPEMIEHFRQIRTGTKASEETKQKMSIAHKKRWAKKHECTNIPQGQH